MPMISTLRRVHREWLRRNREVLVRNGVPAECVDKTARWDRLLCEGEDLASGWQGHWPSPEQCRELLRVMEPECMVPRGGWGNDLLFRLRSQVWLALPERGYVALPLADMAREDPEAYAWPGGCTRVASGACGAQCA